MTYTLIVAVLIQCAGTVANLWSPVAVAKDAQIMLLQDRIRRLEVHRLALDQYEKTRVEWEKEKAAEAESRLAATKFRADVDERLGKILAECRKPR